MSLYSWHVLIFCLSLRYEIIYKQLNLSRIMKTDQTKNYGEYVDITAAIQETVVKPHDLMGGEIWYN